MKRTLILFLLALITGCSPVTIVQPNIDKNKNIETESKTTVVENKTLENNNTVIKPEIKEVVKDSIVKDNNVVLSDSLKSKILENVKPENMTNNSLTSNNSGSSSSSSSNSIFQTNPVPTDVPDSVKNDPLYQAQQRDIQETIDKAIGAGPNITKPRFAENPPEGLPYEEPQREVNPNLKEADIEIFFREEYKIRLERMMRERTEEEKKLTNIEYDEKINGKVEDFISLVDNSLSDLKTINDLFKKYNVIKLISAGSDEPEECHEKKYLENLKSNKGASNIRSYYSISVKDVNVKEFIDTLRTLKIVRSSNVELQVTNH